MFRVKIDTIRERTTNGPTYMKGRQYYRQGQIRQVTYDEKKGIILAQVEGTRTYSVCIILDSNGELHDATCTCSAFSSYWGLCRHIAAVLLYCVDAYGEEKTNITPASQPETAGSVAEKRNEPTSGKARQQALRRNRSKTRDFLSRLERAAALAKTEGKQTVRLQVTLHTAKNASSLPYLSFAAGLDTYEPITNVEQFAEAVSRDLPIELSKDFTFDPLIHCFTAQDQPVLLMLQDAFENDYKAVFGSSHASSHDRYLTLNASRFASFLMFSNQLSDCGWKVLPDGKRMPIRARKENLPLSLLLTENLDTQQSEVPYKLELELHHNIHQLTASRNVYLVDDLFYLPTHDSIRMLEPILSFFTNGKQVLYLSCGEASRLISIMSEKTNESCPLKLQSDLESRLILEPLQPIVLFDTASSGLKAELTWQYGKIQIHPLHGQNNGFQMDERTLVRRDLSLESKVTDHLTKAGFTKQGNSLRLMDPDALYTFLGEPLSELQSFADVRFSPAAQKLKIKKKPDIHIQFRFLDNEDHLLLEQHNGDLTRTGIDLYFQALRENKPYFRNPDGSFCPVDSTWRDVLLLFYDLLQSFDVKPGTRTLLPRYRAFALEPLIEKLPPGPTSDEAPIQIDDQIRQMLHHMHEPGSLTFRIPSPMNQMLRPYQKTGVYWLCMLDYYGLGGILADDMGLGKTIQAIAFVQMLWNKRKKTSLIIAPTSLIYNWLSEFEKFAPQLPVLLIDGNRQQRSSLFSEIGKHACVITSYALLRRDIDEIKDYPFGSCFLDEAQNIKNPDTLNARSVKQIRTERAFALTGTPLENSLLELWSLFDFILPGYLQSQRVFQNRYEIPIIRDHDEEALIDLHRQIAPFILRRMKKDVLCELPDKIESRTICDMTPEQRSIYDAFLTRSRADLKEEIALNGYARSQIYILALLTRLRQICCHPALFLDGYEGGSGKLLLLEELLADCFSSGHRVLVFSQFTSMLEIIRKNQEAKGIFTFYIDGQVPSEERIAQVERFNNGEGNLFLISLRAGGTGLNLTGADTVIHYDPWWNPAVEEQATDRAYRIGQENVVQVFKLFTRHSVEDKILALQQKKKNLIDSIIKPGQNLLSKMTLEEVMSLFEP